MDRSWVQKDHNPVVARTPWVPGAVGPTQIAAAAAIAVPFALYLAALMVLRPPGPLQWAQADPILGLAPRACMPWLVAAAGAGAGVAWWAGARPAARELAAAARQAALGIAVAAALVVALRLLVG